MPLEASIAASAQKVLLTYQLYPTMKLLSMDEAFLFQEDPPSSEYKNLLNGWMRMKMMLPDLNSGKHIYYLGMRVNIWHFFQQ